MLHRVVKPFPVSWDGLTLVDLNAGDERDFGTMTDGLLREGYIEAISAPVERAEEPAASESVADAPADDAPQIEQRAVRKRK